MPPQPRLCVNSQVVHGQTDLKPHGHAVFGGEPAYDYKTSNQLQAVHVETGSSN